MKLKERFRLDVSPRLKGRRDAFGKSLFWAARTQILFWYVAILLFVFLVSIPAFQQLLSARIDQRVRQDMDEKIDAFRGLLGGELLDEDEIESDESFLERKDARLKKPYTKEELGDFFDAYLAKQLPEDEVYIIAFIDGKFFKSSPRARPEILKQDGELMRRWAVQTIETQGKHDTTDPNIGDVLYRVEPVLIQGQAMGVLTIAHTTAGEQAEALEAVSVVIVVIAGVLVLALVLAWFASGRVLSPLRSLSEATELISEADLTWRLDVTGQGQLPELAQSFNEMMDRLQAAFVSQRNFVNDAGHELRTPITIIRGHLELMGDDPDEQAETLAIVMDELDRMTRFVEDLILLAKSERPDFLMLEPVDLTMFLPELLTKARGLAERNWELEGNVEGTILLDRQRITQAMMNLAENATQYTQVGDTIAIGAATRKRMLHLWVRDTGEGIAPQDQERIFNRFARAANSRRRSEGAGLGLSIVKAIAQAHGGEIVVRSQLGQGSTFAMKLPIKLPKEQ